LELDYAELELATGSGQAALDRLEALGTPTEQDLQRVARLLYALASASVGKDPVPALEELLGNDASGDDVWVRAHVALCRSLRDAGDLETAIARGEAAMALLEQRGLSGTDQGVQLAVTLAGVCELSGEISKALRISRKALAEAERLDSPSAQAMAYWNASVCESQVGNIESALELAERALGLLGADGDLRHRAMLRSNVGAFLLMLEPPEPATALEHLDLAVSELSMCGATASEVARSVVEQARAHSMTGGEGRALELLGGVLDERDHLSPFLVADALVLQGHLLWTLGSGGAEDLYRQAVLALATTGQDRAVAKLWYQLAVRFEEVGDVAGALNAYRRAGVASGVAPAASAARAMS
jgi:tetratricopeptide (TPR) repeat protein